MAEDTRTYGEVIEAYKHIKKLEIILDFLGSQYFIFIHQLLMIIN